MQKKKIVSIIAVVTVAIMMFFLQNNEDDNTNVTLTLYGNIDIREAQLAFNSNEHIKTVLVQEGDKVNRGQLLAQLHPELLNAQLTEANASLLAQQELVSKLESGSRPQEITKVQAELSAAKAKATAANDTYQRMKRLLKDKLVSPDDVENLHSQATAAKAQMQAVQASLALLKAGPRKEDIAIAKAQLAAIKAKVTIAEQRLDDASLYAPADGIIRNRILEPGDMASPSSPALTLAFIDPIWVRAYLSETALGKVPLGAKATIFTDSYPEKKYQGWVGYISPTAEFTPKNIQTEELRTRLVFSARIYACNPEGELRLGMPVTVSINLNQKSKNMTSNHCE